MTLENLRKFARLYVPGGKENKIPDDIVDLTLNKGAEVISIITRCLATNKTFNVEAEENTYSLTSSVTRFGCIEKSGLWWNSGDADSPNWKRLKPRTLRWLDKNRTNWRDEDSGDPIFYVQEGDNLIITPTPDTDLDDGFKLYFAQKAPSMTQDDHYAFSGSTTEIARLAIFDEAILRYWEWKAYKMLGQKSPKDLQEAKQDFKNEVAEAQYYLDRRPDIVADKKTKFMGIRVK